MKDFLNEWGQTHKELCINLELDPKTSDDIIMLDFFWYKNLWIPKENSLYTEKDLKIVEKIKNL
jgi:hypothetical protein